MHSRTGGPSHGPSIIASLDAPPPTVLLEGASLSQHLIDELARAAATYTTLAVRASLHPFNNDHVPFTEIGIPVVLTNEGADSTNANIHSARDMLDSIDYDLALEILSHECCCYSTSAGIGTDVNKGFRPVRRTGRSPSIEYGHDLCSHTPALPNPMMSARPSPVVSARNRGCWSTRHPPAS